MSTYKGTIVTWKSDRGFGFIKPEEGGKEVFIHIKGLNHRQYQPNIGDQIEYKLTTDKTGRIRAYDALIDGVEPYTREPQQDGTDTATQNSGSSVNKPLLIGVAIVIAIIVAWVASN